MSYHPEFSKMPHTVAAAREAGAMFYYTGEPCGNGHISPRYASSANCVECINVKRGIAISASQKKARRMSDGNHALAIDAINRGEKVFSALRPCKNGHYIRCVTTGNCVECATASREKHKDSARWRRIYSLYGMSREQFFAMLSEQDSKCGICFKAIDQNACHIDHCHSTGKVRSLLCGKCNQAIGLLNEDLEIINSAADYIKRHQNGR